MLRKTEKYLDPETDIEKEKLIEDNNFDEGMVYSIFEKFYGRSITVYM